MSDPIDPGPEGYVYFLDYDEETSAVNVFAAVTNRGLFGDNTERYTGGPNEVFRDRRPIRTAELEGFGAVFSRSNSGVCWTGANPECLGPRIPEALARRLHPQLYERIEDQE